MRDEPGTEYRAVFRRPTDTKDMRSYFDSVSAAEKALERWRDIDGTIGHVEYRETETWRKVGEAPAGCPECERLNGLFANMADILQLVVSKWEICRDLRDTMELAKAAVAEAHRVRAGVTRCE